MFFSDAGKQTLKNGIDCWDMSLLNEYSQFLNYYTKPLRNLTDFWNCTSIFQTIKDQTSLTKNQILVDDYCDNEDISLWANANYFIQRFLVEMQEICEDHFQVVSSTSSNDNDNQIDDTDSVDNDQKIPGSNDNQTMPIDDDDSVDNGQKIPNNGTVSNDNQSMLANSTSSNNNSTLRNRLM